MSQLTPKQARAVDAVLTAVARGTAHVWSPVANWLFPLVPVVARGGFVIEFGKEDFQLVSSVRAPGAGTKRVQFGHQGASYALTDFSLEALVPIELGQEASQVGIDLYERSIKGVQRLMDTEREYLAGQIARNAASYPASNKKAITTDADRWDDPTSDPLGDIADARDAIRAAIGVYPNTMVLPPKALKALLRHPDVLALLSDTTLKVATLDHLKTITEIPNIMEGGATYWDPQAGAFVDIWGKDVIIAYTEIASLADGGSPAYGYTYQLEGYPFVEEPYVERNAKSAVAPVTDARKPVLAGPLAGYLIQNVVQ